MFCGKCGTRNPDEDLFCFNCGASLRRGDGSVTAPAPAAPVYAPAAPVYTPPAPAAPYGSSGASEWVDRVRMTMKDLFKGPLFLATIICYTLIQLIGLASITSGSVFADLYGIADEMGIGESVMRETLSGIESMVSSLSLLSMVPGILVTIGLWMVFGSAVSDQRQMKASGLVIVRVVQLIQACLMGAVFALLLFGILMALGNLGSESIYDDLKTALSTVLFVCLIVAALVLSFYGMIISSIKKVEQTIDSNVPDPTVSMGLAVFLFISGGASAIGLLTGGMTLTSLLQTAETILWGVNIVVYRSKMSELEGESYLQSRARIVSVGRSSSTSSDIPAWKRVQIEQGLDD